MDRFDHGDRIGARAIRMQQFRVLLNNAAVRIRVELAAVRRRAIAFAGLVRRLASFDVGAALSKGGCWLIRQGRRQLRRWRWLLARIAFALGRGAYVLGGLLMLAALALDWSTLRLVDAAESSMSDLLLAHRPLALQAPVSGRIVVVEIDDCSIAALRQAGEGGWPWPRRRHAHLVAALEDLGVRVIGYDVIMIDALDAGDDNAFVATVEGFSGQIFMATSWRHDPADGERAPPVDSWLAARPLLAGAPAPRSTGDLLFHPDLSRRAGYANIVRAADGMVRDLDLWQAHDGWALPSLPALVAAALGKQSFTDLPLRLQPFWRRAAPLPRVSAADLIRPDLPCGSDLSVLSANTGLAAMIGHAASGLNDIKPTPIERQMTGVQLLGEAAEAAVTGHTLLAPPGWVRYLLCVLAAVGVTIRFALYEPARLVGSELWFAELLLLVVAVPLVWLTGIFPDVFTAMVFLALCYGVCSIVQRYRIGIRTHTQPLNPALADESSGMSPNKRVWRVRCLRPAEPRDPRDPREPREPRDPARVSPRHLRRLENIAHRYWLKHYRLVDQGQRFLLLGSDAPLRLSLHGLMGEWLLISSHAEARSAEAATDLQLQVMDACGFSRQDVVAGDAPTDPTIDAPHVAGLRAQILRARQHT